MNDETRDVLFDPARLLPKTVWLVDNPQESEFYREYLAERDTIDV